MTESGLEGWGEYKRLILQELERLARQVQDLNNKIDTFRASDIGDIKVEVAMLKVKAGMWGALAGAIPSAVVLIWWLVSD